MRNAPQHRTLGWFVALSLVMCAGCAPKAFVWLNPEDQVRVAAMVNVTSEHAAIARWLGDSPDALLLSGEEVADLNRRNGVRPGAGRDVLEGAFGAQTRVHAELEERIAWLQTRVDDGRYRSERPGGFSEAVTTMRTSLARDEARIALAAADVRCVPMQDGLYTQPADPDFDRNQCTRLHPGEVVRVLRESADGRWWYVSTTHGVGWSTAAGFTPALPIDQVRTYQRQTPRLVILADGARTASGLSLRMGTHLPMIGRDAQGRPQVLAPHATGLGPTTVLDPDHTHEGYLPFTRRHALKLALSQLGSPYGWGGRAGHRDCSRLLLDVFSAFGMTLGRHSRVQSVSGAHTADLSELTTEAKRTAIVGAMARGLVLAYMPGHIMLVLGEADGRVFALSAISEFLIPGDDGDQVQRLDLVTLSDLQVGAGTTRGSFLERMTTLAIFGPP